MKLTRMLVAFPSLLLLPWLILLLTLVVTFAVWHGARSNSEAIKAGQFKLRTAEVETDIQARMLAYEQVLQGVEGLFDASVNVERGEFRTYVDSLKLAKRYPGIQALGFAQRVSTSGRDRLVAQVRAAGFPDFRLRPSGRRAVYSAIVYIEPFDWRNQRAFGYDMYSEPVRHAAMERAWLQDRLAISGKVTLVQEVDHNIQPGFLMYLPVYRHGMPHVTAAERRKALVGWVYAAFRMYDLIDGVGGRHYGEDQSALDIEIFDGTDLRRENLLYDSDGVDRTDTPGVTAYKSVRQIEIGGQTWTLAVYSMPAFDAGQDGFKLNAILVSGTVGSVLLALVLWLLINGRSRAMRLAAAMNRDVLERESQLKEAQAIAHVGSWDWHVASDQVACSDEMCRLFGYPAERRVASLQELQARIHPEDRDKVQAAMDETRKSGAPYDLTHRLILPDGRTREVRAKGKWGYTADGEAIRLSGTLMDVTEQMRSKRSLEASARYQKLLLEHLPAAVLVYGTDAMVRYCNAEASRVLGVDEAEMLGRNAESMHWRLLSDDGAQLDTAAHPVNLVLSSGEALHGYVIGVDRGKDGDTLWLLSSAFPQLDDDGRVLQVIVSFIDITDRRHSDAVLRRTLVELDDLYNHAPCGYHSLDAEGRVIRINQTELDWLGYRREDVIGKSFANLLSPAGQVVFRASYPEFKSRGFVHDLEIELSRKDGTRMIVLINASAILDADGKFLLSRSTLYDITDRKQAESALERTRTELQRIVDISPAAIYRVELDPEEVRPARVAFLGRIIVDLAGYELEAWHAPGFWQAHIHPDDRPKVVAAQDRLFREGHLEHEYRFLCRDGRPVWIYDRLVLVRDDRGRPCEIVGTWLDISGRIEAEQGLQRLNRFYALLSHANEAIVRLPNETRLFEEVCRLAVEEGGQRLAWVGMLDMESSEVRPLAWAGYDDGYLAFLEQSGVFRHSGPTTRAILENSRYVNQDMVANPVMKHWREEAIARGYRSSAAFPLRRNGHPVGALTLYSDAPNSFSDEIVELFERLVDDVSFALDFIDQDKRRRLAELRLARLNEDLELRVAERTRMLESANKELEAFSYSVSHDLRAPLRGIDGFSQLLERKCGDQLDETGRDYLRRVQQASKRMGELIDDLLQLSRVSRIELIMETVDLSQIAGEVVEDLRAQDPERNVEVDIQPGITAHGDGRLIRAVLENLLGNAWKFTTRQMQPRIEFGSRQIDGKIAYFVRDNGAGFDMRYAAKLFGAFQRLHRAEDFEGTGIGLATVQRIVNRHGGRVWADAAVGQGATFHFTLD